MVVNRALTRNGRPVGRSPHNQSWRHRAEWYAPFQDLGTIEFEATERATQGLNMDHAGAHMTWSTEDDVPERNTPLDYYRTHFLQKAPHPRARNGNGRDVEQYNHLVLNMCGGRGNTFQAETMKDLYFFLKHAGSRRNAIAKIRHIEVVDMTGGPYVLQALAQLKLCTGLRQLDLRMCRGCKDFHATHAKKQRWADTRLHVNRGHFQLDISCRAADEKLCDTCEAKSKRQRAAPSAALRDWKAAQPARLQASL